MSATRRVLTLTSIALLSLATPGQGQLPNAKGYFSDPIARDTAPQPIIEGFARFVDSAKESVAFIMWRLDLPEVVDALVRAKKRGVAVRVVTDDDAMHHRFRPFYKQLEAAKIPVHVDRGTVFNVVIHHKFCVVDDTWVWTGDWNTAKGDTYATWHAACHVKSPGLARAYLRQFDKHFAGAPQGVEGEYELPRKLHEIEGGGRARAHFGFEEVLGEVLVREIQSAKRRIDFSHAYLRDQRVVMALLAAWRRGVKIRVQYTKGTGTLIQSLARFGVPIRLQLPVGLGTKYVIVDGRRLLTGSYNCTFDPAHENLAVFVDVRPLARAYARHFERTWKQAKPYFLPANHASLTFEDRVRDGLVEKLRATAVSALPPMPLPKKPDAFAPPERTFETRTPKMEPVGVGWHSGEAGSDLRRYYVSFRRNGAVKQGDACRIVVSYSRFASVDGVRIASTMRPVVLDDTSLRNVDAELALPWLVPLPKRPHKYRVDLDVFEKSEAGQWEWVANYRIPPPVIQVNPGTITAKGLSHTEEIPIGDGWRAHKNCVIEDRGIRGTGPWGLAISPRLDFDTSRMTHFWFRLTSGGADKVKIVWLGPKGKTVEKTVPVISDSRPRTYTVRLAGDREWINMRKLVRIHFGMGVNSEHVTLHTLGLGR